MPSHGGLVSDITATADLNLKTVNDAADEIVSMLSDEQIFEALLKTFCDRRGIRLDHGQYVLVITSYSIHYTKLYDESQSRFWENMIGRSMPFWERYYPEFQKLFSKQTEGVSLDSFYKAVNQVVPSFIRVEADEVTYGLHIILRFELEKALLSGELEVSSLPGEWNRRTKELLGIVPKDDAEGVLQDVVITSYSIHYTKLYESFWGAAEEECLP